MESATALQSFIFETSQFPTELVAQIFSALESKTNLTNLTIVGGILENHTDGQLRFGDYFCKLFLARGKQLEKLKFKYAVMQIELAQQLVDIATSTMTSLNTLAFSNFIDASFTSALSPAVLKLYAAWISKSNLTELRITESQLSSNDVMILIEGLTRNTSIIKLILAKNQIGDSGALALATALELNSSLTWLDLSSNKIGDNGASSLVSLLKRNSSLKRLDLTGNHLTAAGLQHLAFGIKTNKGLAELYLDTPPVRMGTVTASMCPALKLCLLNSSLKHLALNDFQIPDSTALLDLIAKNKSLTALELARVKTLDWTGLANVLRTNKTLLSLNLSGAETTINSATQNDFMLALGQSNLTRVNLSQAMCILGDASAAVLSEALLGNKRLQSLDLSRNDLKTVGLLSFTKVLATNTTLLELDLSHNTLERCGALFDALLTQNTTLTSLSARCSRIDGQSHRIICEIVATKPNLFSLDLSENWQLTQVRPQLATALQSNKSLVKCLMDFQSQPPFLVRAVAACKGVPRLRHVIEKTNANVLRHLLATTQRIWLAKKMFKLHVRALRAAQIVLLAPDRGIFTCLPGEILELVFGAMAGHALAPNDFLVKFAKQRERLKYERALTNKVDFLREYLHYLNSAADK